MRSGTRGRLAAWGRRRRLIGRAGDSGRRRAARRLARRGRRWAAPAAPAARAEQPEPGHRGTKDGAPGQARPGQAATRCGTGWAEGTALAGRRWTALDGAGRRHWTGAGRGGSCAGRSGGRARRSRPGRPGRPVRPALLWARACSGWAPGAGRWASLARPACSAGRRWPSLAARRPTAGPRRPGDERGKPEAGPPRRLIACRCSAEGALGGRITACWPRSPSWFVGPRLPGRCRQVPGQVPAPGQDRVRRTRNSAMCLCRRRAPSRRLGHCPTTVHR